MLKNSQSFRNVLVGTSHGLSRVLTPIEKRKNKEYY